MVPVISWAAAGHARASATAAIVNAPRHFMGTRLSMVGPPRTRTLEVRAQIWTDPNCESRGRRRGPAAALDARAAEAEQAADDAHRHPTRDDEHADVQGKEDDRAAQQVRRGQ